MLEEGRSLQLLGFGGKREAKVIWVGVVCDRGRPVGTKALNVDYIVVFRWLLLVLPEVVTPDERA